MMHNFFIKKIYILLKINTNNINTQFLTKYIRQIIPKMITIFDTVTGKTYKNVEFDFFNGTNGCCVFYAGQSTTRYSIPRNQVEITEKKHEPETEAKSVPLSVPTAEEEGKKVEEALVLIGRINTEDTYTFKFISGEYVGNFLSNNENTMFINVKGSGRVTIPLSWLIRITAV
jgi:hypothetical protein